MNEYIPHFKVAIMQLIINGPMAGLEPAFSNMHLPVNATSAFCKEWMDNLTRSLQSELPFIRGAY